MKPTLVVLAAGIGSRYGGLKQMDPMGPSGEFIIDYSVFDAIRAGFDRVVFVVSAKIENDFKSIIGSRLQKHVAVDYVRQELDDLPPGFSLPATRQKPWGTGHAILACRNAVHAPFAAINADDFYGRDSFRVLGDFLQARSSGEGRYAMVGFVLRNTLSEHGHVARGVCTVDETSFLKKVVERTKIEKDGDGARFLDSEGNWQKLTGNELVSMNMWGFTPSIFDYLAKQFPPFLKTSGQDPKSEFFIPTVVDNLINDGTVSTNVLKTSESWFGVTYPEDKQVVLKRLMALVDGGVYPKSLWA